MSKVHSSPVASVPGGEGGESAPKRPPVFVFGSNLAGRHGKGAALWALQHRGAIYGQAIGIQGDSYAIPTKDEKLRTLPLGVIRDFVGEFLYFAEKYWMKQFQLTPIGCGLAGYTPDQIAPMFRGAPPNVILPPEFGAALSASPNPTGAGVNQEADHG